MSGQTDERRVPAWFAPAFALACVLCFGLLAYTVAEGLLHEHYAPDNPLPRALIFMGKPAIPTIVLILVAFRSFRARLLMVGIILVLGALFNGPDLAAGLAPGNRAAATAGWAGQGLLMLGMVAWVVGDAVCKRRHARRSARPSEGASEAHP